MRKVLLLVAVSPFITTCTGEPETVPIRLIDGFQSTMVQGSPPAAELERTEWRFDGEGAIPAPEEEGETFGWIALNDVSDLSVRDGMLIGSTGALPVLAGALPEGLDEDDLLYAIEVRMRVSAGAEVGIQLDGARERDDDWAEARIEQLTDQARRQLRAELTPGDDFVTYTLREAGANFRISAARNVLLIPSDVEGAEFEIESLRLIPLKEHLASIPSGPGW